MNKYSIAYQGLSVGNHQFSFDIEESLFAQFGQEDCSKGAGRVVVNLEKHPNFMALHTEITGEVEVVCDRCLDHFMHEVAFEGELFVKFSTEVKEPEYDILGKNSDEEVLWIHPSDDHIDLASYIYESMLLALPVQRIHPEDENGESMCDKDMLSRFVLAQEQEDGDDDYLDDEDDDFDFDDEEDI